MMDEQRIREAPINTELPAEAAGIPMAIVARLIEQNLLLKEIAAQLAEIKQAFTASEHGALGVTCYQRSDR